MKKILWSVILIIIFIAISVGTFMFFYWQSEQQSEEQSELDYYKSAYHLSSSDCTDENNKETSCTKCIKKGKIFAHSFGGNCEIEAKDSGKECVYNDECIKGNCVYEYKNSSGLIGAGTVTSDKGHCDGFIGDNDGETNCNFDRRSNKPSCSMDIS